MKLYFDSSTFIGKVQKGTVMRQKVYSSKAAGLLARITLLMGTVVLGTSCGLIPDSRQDGGLSFQQGVDTNNFQQSNNDDAKQIEQELLSRYYTEFNKRLDEEVSALKQADAALENKINELRVRLDEFEKFVKAEIDNLKAADALLREDMKAMEARIEKRMDALESEIDEVEKLANANAVEIVKVRGDLTAAIATSVDALRVEMNDLRQKAIEGIRKELETGLQTAENNLKAAKEALELADQADRAAAQAALDAHLIEYNRLKADYDVRMKGAEESIVKLGQALEKQAQALEDYKKEAERIYLTKAKFEAFKGDSDTLQGALSVLKAELIGQDGKSGLVGAMIKTKYDELHAHFTKEIKGLDGKLGDLEVRLLGPNKDGKGGYIGALETSISDATKKIERMEVQGITEIKTAIEKYKSFSVEIRNKFNVPGISQADLFVIAFEYQSVASAYRQMILDAIKVMRETFTGNGDSEVIKMINQVDTDYTNAIALEIDVKNKAEALIKLSMERLEEAHKVANEASAMAKELQKDGIEYEKTMAQLRVDVDNNADEIARVEGLLSDLDKEFEKHKGEVAQAALDMAGTITELTNRITGVEGGLEDVNKKVAHNINEMNDMKIKHNSLLVQHDELVKKFAISLKDAQAEKDLQDAKLAAQSALEDFLRKKAELKLTMLQVLNPSQVTKDFYDASFRVDVGAVEGAKCQVQDVATFGNAAGIDAQEHLVREFINSAIYGQNLSVPETVLNLGLNNSMLADKTRIQRSAIIGALETFPVVESESCRANVEAWAKRVFAENLALASKDDTKIWDHFNKSADFKRDFSELKSTIVDYAKKWQTYQEMLISIDGDLTDDQIRDIAALILKQKMTEIQLGDLSTRFDQFKNGMIEQVNNLNTVTGTNAAANAANAGALAQLQADFNQKLKVLNEKNLALDEYVKKTIDEKLKALPATEQIQGSLLETIKIVASIAERLGYADLVVRAENAGKMLDQAFTIDASAMFVSPKISHVQHMFGDLYNNVAQGKITDQDGNVISTQNWNDYWAKWNRDQLTNGSRFTETCSTSNLGIGDQYGALSGKTFGHCWINFRGAPIANYHNNVVQNIVIRLFGSAEFIDVKMPNNKHRVYMVSDRGDSRRHAELYVGEKILGDSKAILTRTPEINEIIRSVPASVQGSSYMGAFDIHEPDLLQTQNTNSTTNFTFTFTPVRYMTNGDQNSPDYGKLVNVGSNGDHTNGVGKPKSHQMRLYSPIVLDFINHGMLQTTSQLDRPVQFDLDANGYKETTGWVDGVDAYAFRREVFCRRTHETNHCMFAGDIGCHGG